MTGQRKKGATARQQEKRINKVCKVCSESVVRVDRHFDKVHAKLIRRQLEDDLNSRIEVKLAEQSQHLGADLLDKLRRELLAKGAKDIAKQIATTRTEAIEYGNDVKKASQKNQLASSSEIIAMLGPFSGARERVEVYMQSKGFHLVVDVPPNMPAAQPVDLIDAADPEPDIQLNEPEECDDYSDEASQEYFAGAIHHSHGHEDSSARPKDATLLRTDLDHHALPLDAAAHGFYSTEPLANSASPPSSLRHQLRADTGISNGADTPRAARVKGMRGVTQRCLASQIIRSGGLPGKAAVLQPPAAIIAQRTLTPTARADCIRVRGLPNDAQAQHILEFLGVFADYIISPGVRIIAKTKERPNCEAFIQMDSEQSARSCAAVLHNDTMRVGTNDCYVDCQQCSADGFQQTLTNTAPLPADSRAASTSIRTGQLSSSMHRSLQSISGSTQQSFDNHVPHAALASFGAEAANAHSANLAQSESDAGCSVLDEYLSLRLCITQHPLLLEFYEHLREERPSAKAETQASQTVACVARTLHKHYAMNGLGPSSHALSVDYVVQSGPALKSFCDDFYAMSRNAWSTRNFVTSYRRFVNFLMARRSQHRIMLEALKATVESLERQYQRLAYARQNQCLGERFQRTSGKADYAALISILDSARVGATIAAIAKVIRNSPERLSRSQYANFSYYLQCAVVFRNAQRPEIVRTLTVKEFLEATARQPVNGLFVIEIADNKNAPKVTRVVVPESDFDLMHLYLRKLRPLHAKSSDQEGPGSNDAFFINKNGRRFVNTGVTLQRWLRGRGVENAAPNKVRRAAATRVAENFPLGSKTSRSAAILMGHSERTRNRHYLDHPAADIQVALNGYSALKALVSASGLPKKIKNGVFFTEEFKRRLFELHPVSLSGSAPSFSESQLCPCEINDRPSFMRSVRDLWRNERKKLYTSQKPSAQQDDHSCSSPDMIQGTPRPKVEKLPRRNQIIKRVTLRQSESRDAGPDAEIDPSILLPLPLDVDEYLRRSNFLPWQNFPWVRVVDLPGGQGRGVILLCRAAQGQLLFDYKGTRISKREHEEQMSTMDESSQRIVESYRLLLPAEDCYVLSHDESYLGISSFGRLCNHSAKHGNIYPVSRVLQRSDGFSCNAILFFAKRNIAANEELTWDYGQDFRNAVWYNECHCPICGGRCNCTSCKGLSTHPRPPPGQVDSSAAEPAELRLKSLQIEDSLAVHSSQITPPSHFGLSGYLEVFGKRNHLFVRQTNHRNEMSVCALLHQQLLGTNHQMTPDSIQQALSGYRQDSDGNQSSFAGVFQLLAAKKIPSVLLFHESEAADVKGISIHCDGQAASCIIGLYYLADSSQWSILVPPFAHGASRLRKPATAKSFTWAISGKAVDEQVQSVLAELPHWCISKIAQPNQKNNRLSAKSSPYALNDPHSMQQQRHDLAMPPAHSSSRPNLKRNAGPHVGSSPVPAKGSRGKR